MSNQYLPDSTATPSQVARAMKSVPWVKRINLLLLGLVLATGIKVLIEPLFDAPMPPASFPEIGGGFTLTSDKGPVSLHDFKDKVVLLSFGYTHCPDVCPTTLSNVANALRMLKETQDLSHVQSLFVTLDSERDTPEKLGEYVAYFHSGMIGLGGNSSEIAKVANQYKVNFQKDPSDSAGGYTMSHLSYIFVIRPDGSIGELLSHSTPPKGIVKAVQHWLPWSK